jgi:hypothetical protein
MFWERDADRRTEAQAGVPAGRGAGGSRIYCITVPLLLRPAPNPPTRRGFLCFAYSAATMHTAGYVVK